MEITMQCEPQEMADYQQINPYEMIYKNMNFQINEHISKQTAEKIARQLAFMHNAFGIVAKDLIKILSFKFTDTQHHTQQQHQKNNKKEDTRPSKHRERPPIQPMEVEDHQLEQAREVGSKKRVVEGVTGAIAVPGERESEVRLVQKQDRIQEKPPNLDFLGEFAYEKSGHEQSKNPTKDKLETTFKLKLSKIVEEVSNKRKKSNKYSPPPQATANHGKNDDREHLANKTLDHKQHAPTENSPKVSESHQDKTVHQKQGFQTEQTPAIFQQFEYESRKQEKEKQSEVQCSQERHEQMQGNKLWHLLQQNKQSPPVYQIISDDDDE